MIEADIIFSMKKDYLSGILSEFAERLKEAMFYAGLSPAQLAEETGINVSSLYHYLEARHMPTVDMLVRLADRFSCSADFLLGLVDMDRETAFAPCPDFRERFPVLLKELNTNKYRLCKRVGISNSAAYSWQSGEKSPSLEAVVAIAKTYERSVDFVLGREK